MMYFAELRKSLSRTDAIQIIFADDEVCEDYLCIDNVPESYNLYEVYGIGNNDTIETDYGLMKGLEILLRKTNFHSCQPQANNEIKETPRNLINSGLNLLNGGLKWISNHPW